LIFNSEESPKKQLGKIADEILKDKDFTWFKFGFCFGEPRRNSNVRKFITEKEESYKSYSRAGLQYDEPEPLHYDHKTESCLIKIIEHYDNIDHCTNPSAQTAYLKIDYVNIRLVGYDRTLKTQAFSEFDTLATFQDEAISDICP
jgi:hypothetical protein